LKVRSGATCSIDDISGNEFILVGFDVRTESMRELLIHPLAQQQQWRAIAIGIGRADVRAEEEIETATIVGDEMEATFMEYRGQLALVRPDRYVALIGDKCSVEADMDILWRSFGRVPLDGDKPEQEFGLSSRRMLTGG